MTAKSNKDSMQTESTQLNSWQKEILQRWQKTKALSISQSLKDELKIKFDGEVLFDEPMSKHTYIKIGGPADVFLKPKSVEAARYAIALAHENNIPYTFIGWGANTLVRDGGVRGFVICLFDSLKNHQVLQDTDDFVDIEVEAGLNFSRLIHIAKDLGGSTLAPFTGIPGSVGGLISMNAGIQGKEIKDCVREITILTKEGELKTISREHLDFEYRHLKMVKANLIVKAVFRVEKHGAIDEIEAEIKRHQKRRQDTQPLEYPNLGCMFKNPLPQKKNEVVASAGKLVEEVGLKNVRIGGARISTKHGNFIINEGKAQAKDVLALMSMIKDRVKTTTGIVLEPEVKIIGEENDGK